jgi:hypothetical protein
MPPGRRDAGYAGSISTEKEQSETVNATAGSRPRQAVKSEHDVQRDRVRASFLAVPGEPTSRQPQEKPALFNRITSR